DHTPTVRADPAPGTAAPRLPSQPAQRRGREHRYTKPEQRTPVLRSAQTMACARRPNAATGAAPKANSQKSAPAPRNSAGNTGETISVPRATGDRRPSSIESDRPTRRCATRTTTRIGGERTNGADAASGAPRPPHCGSTTTPSTEKTRALLRSQLRPQSVGDRRRGRRPRPHLRRAGTTGQPARPPAPRVRRRRRV